MNKKIIVLQDGYKECGAACLLSIIKYYNGYIPISKLVDELKITKSGTNFYNLKQTAIKFNLETQAFKIDKKDYYKLEDIKLPAIAQIISNNYEHFVVIYKYHKKNITIMDPAMGIKTYKIDNFFRKWTGYIMSFSQKGTIPKYKGNNYLSKVIIDTIIKNKGIVLSIIILSIIYTITTCTIAMYSGIVIDYVLPNSYNLLIITCIFGIIIIIKSITNFLKELLFINIYQKLDCSIFVKTFQKILLLPYSYYKSRTTGEIISRINDLSYVKSLITKIILTVFLDLIISFGSGLFLIIINYKLFIIVIITILAYIFIFYIFHNISCEYTNINQENNAHINSLMIELISGFSTIKNLNLESRSLDKISSLYAKGLNDSYIYDTINSLELFIKDLVNEISTILLTFLSFCLVFKANLSAGVAISYVTIASYFILPIKAIIDTSQEYYYTKNSLKRINDLFEYDSDNFDDITDFPIKGNIRINNLSYSYNDYKQVINNLNLDIHASNKILILGKSGTGKSTLLKLLLKYYQVNRDSIYLDNIDINDISIKNIRDNISLISQEEIIFTRSIRDNIILDRHVSNIEFDRICKLVKVDEIVNNMFLGYDTILEEGGKNISGGQRQRIILARTLLKGTNIVLIDEGLSALDVDMEREIVINLFNYFKKKTFIIVSHRFNNMDLYDRVIDLNNI